MTLIVGLGNPTENYKKNRHNIGFQVIDSLVDELKPLKINKNIFNAQLYKINSIFLLKPATYMNNSGFSVSSVAKYYKITNIIVVHDDIELPFGSIRIKHGGGNGGHNGLKSIDAHYGKGYDRIRIGIGKPQNKEDIANYVLSDFSKKESTCLPTIVSYVKDTVLFLLNNDIAETAAKFTVRKSLCSKTEV